MSPDLLVTVVLYLFAFIFIVICNSIWLAIMRGFYSRQLAGIIPPAASRTHTIIKLLALWALFAWSFVYLVPIFGCGNILGWHGMIRGLVYGLSISGIYHLMSWLLFSLWPLPMMLVDIGWHALLFAVLGFLIDDIGFFSLVITGQMHFGP